MVGLEGVGLRLQDWEHLASYWDTLRTYERSSFLPFSTPKNATTFNRDLGAVSA